MLSTMLWIIATQVVPYPAVPAPGREFKGYFGRNFTRLPGLCRCHHNGVIVWVAWWNVLLVVLFVAELDISWIFLIDFGRRLDDHIAGKHELDKEEHEHEAEETMVR